MNMKFLATTAIVAMTASGAFAHDAVVKKTKADKLVVCEWPLVLDPVTNLCVAASDNEAFSSQDNVDTDNDFENETTVDYPGNSDNHRQDIGRAQRTGNNGRGTTVALDGGDPPGKGNTKNDLD